MLNQIQVRGNAIPELSTVQALLESAVQLPITGIAGHLELKWADLLHFTCKALLQVELELRQRVLPKLSNPSDMLALCEAYKIAKAYWAIPEAEFNVNATIAIPDHGLAGNRPLRWVDAYELLMFGLYNNYEVILGQSYAMSYEARMLVAEVMVIAEHEVYRMGDHENSEEYSTSASLIQDYARLARADYLASQLHFRPDLSFTRELNRVLRSFIGEAKTAVEGKEESNL